MSSISTEEIKQLREKTGVSIMQCKKALEEAGGDMDKALVILQKRSKEVADKKQERALKAGVVASYIHANNSVGSLVELLCETDFVAKNNEFQELGYEIAMHVAAMNPEFVTEKEITEEDRAAANEVFKEEVADKPEEMREKILAGKMDSFFADKILLKQKYIKDNTKTIEDLIKSGVQKFGENIEIGRVARFSTSG